MTDTSEKNPTPPVKTPEPSSDPKPPPPENPKPFREQVEERERKVVVPDEEKSSALLAMIVLSTVLFCGTIASANDDKYYDDHFYGGVSLGATLFSGDKTILYGGPVSLPEDDIGGKDVALKIYGGYRANKYIGFELAGHRFGVPTEKTNKLFASIAKDQFDIDLKSEDIANSYTAYAITASILAIIPVGKNIEIFPKLGVVYATLSSDQSKPMQTAIGDWAVANDDGFAILFGVGFNLKLLDNLSLRGEAEYIPNIANALDAPAETRMEIINKEFFEDQKKDVPEGILPKFAYQAEVDVLVITGGLVWRF